MNGLDLFSGIGGNTLALGEWVRTVAYCERDPHAQAVLLSRMSGGDIEPAPIWDDVATLTREHFDVPVDIVVGGFPCQDISSAGKGAGIREGTRSGLFFHVVRLIRELRPAFVFLENVAAIRTRGLDTVLRELTEAGYDCRWTMLAASSVGAPHRRERWFLLAHANGDRPQGGLHQAGAPDLRRRPAHEGGAPAAVADAEVDGRDEGRQVAPGGGERDSSEGHHGRGPADGGPVADPDGGRWPEQPRPVPQAAQGEGHPHPWEAEPDVGRVADGVPLRVDRLSRLGNAVVPVQAREAFMILAGLYD